ncbi:MAG: GNAT family N-acetyltransferase [Cardiobacteriaceae bacterium]|nr:GNAT family N-acetyltransferase [Cardiobacteriaceae bacterium]
MHIRLFLPNDAEALTALLHAAYAELGARGLNFTAVDQDAATTLQRASAGQCWIMEDDAQRPIATLTMSYPPSQGIRELTPEARQEHCAWLNQLAVCPQHRGQGLARQLWQTGKAWARAQGAHSIGLDTALPATHLIALYANWGFVQRDTIHWPGKTYDSAVMILQSI